MNDCSLYWYVDVQDTARLHVVALLDSTVKSERIFAAPSSGQTFWVFSESIRARELLRKFFGRENWITLKGSLAEGIVDVEKFSDPI
jgi:hypothetical protein